MSEFVSKDELKKLCNDVNEPETVDIKNFGKISIKALSLQERMECRQLATMSDEMDIAKFQNYVIIKCLLNPKLELIDIAWLDTLPSGIADQIITQIYRKSGIDIENVQQIKKK